MDQTAVRALLTRLLQLEAPLRETSSDFGHGYSTREVGAYVAEVEQIQAEAERLMGPAY